MAIFDLVVRGGTIFDGSGGESYVADVGVKDGKILAIGPSLAAGAEEIDAGGKMVTPGFVDIHTHYDGQVIWEDRTEPSAAHGVTTAIMGNCGVGFAPCRPQDRDRLIQLMEGVEDVPEIVMAEGLPWNWETFEDYLDVVDARHRDIDVAAQLPHSCLRVYVMGERASAREDSTPADQAEMRDIAERAMRVGAIGFATSRSIFHRDRNGVAIPTKEAGEAELQAIAEGVAAAGAGGVIEALIDYDDLEGEFGLLKRLGGDNGLPVSFTLAQTVDHPDAWQRALKLIEAANAEGIEMRGQIIGRPTGLVLGLDLSFNPFSLYPACQPLAALPLAERVAEMRKPEVRAQILGGTPEESNFTALKLLKMFEIMYPLGDPPNYEPKAEDSVAARAARAGVKPTEMCYDILVEGDGKTTLFVPFSNFVKGNLDDVLIMLKHKHTVLGLGDGGAHYGSICDAGYPTFMLTYWTRDRQMGERLPVAEVVKQLTADPARTVGLNDRGRIAPGYKADLNIIDYDRLHLCAPTVRFDLPASGRRLIQEARGYVATIVSGVPTYREGVATGALPGRLVRGAQSAPPAVTAVRKAFCDERL